MKKYHHKYNEGDKPVNEPESDPPKDPSRRDFMENALFLVLGAGVTVLCTSCDKSPTTPEPPEPPIEQPATEEEGRTAMKDAANTVMQEKGYIYEIRENVEFYTDKAGKYDIGVFIDTDNDGDFDLRLGMNYVTEGETLQNLQDTARYKFKEIVKSSTPPVTTKEYLTKEFKEWMREVV